MLFKKVVLVQKNNMKIKNHFDTNGKHNALIFCDHIPMEEEGIAFEEKSWGE